MTQIMIVKIVEVQMKVYMSMVSQNITSYFIRAGRIAGNTPHTITTFIHHVNNC